MGLSHWLARKLMFIMGNAYVWLDRRVQYTENEVSSVLGLKIDEDFKKMTRRQLCAFIEKKFGVTKDHFWNLHSTQKIRFCCQMVRDNKLGVRS